MWARAAYPSRKPLGAWLRDLSRRIAALDAWLVGGEPRAFWLPGFFFPQGFVTAVLQNRARRLRAPVDALRMQQRVLGGAEAEEALRRPRRRPTTARAGGAVPAGGAAGGGATERARYRGSCDGGHSGGGGGGSGPEDDGAVFVYGLVVEGASWDGAAGTLQEARPGETTCPLPPVELRPVDHRPRQHQQQQQRRRQPGEQPAASASTECSSVASPCGLEVTGAADDDSRSGAAHRCPLYRTSSRADYVMHLDLPMPRGSSEAAWVLQGVAALCSLDDE